MTESMPPTLAQMQQLNRSLTEKVLDKAASDPQWKQQLIDDPEAAMRAANFPESQQLEQMRANATAQQGEEVRGQFGNLWSDRGSDSFTWPSSGLGGAFQVEPSCPHRCYFHTHYWQHTW